MGAEQNGAQLERSVSAATFSTHTSGGGGGEGEDSALGPWPAAAATAQVAGGGVFEGCYFTLAALRGAPEEARLARHIQAAGGRLFMASTVNHVAARVPDRTRIFAVCPQSLPPATASQVGYLAEKPVRRSARTHTPWRCLALPALTSIPPAPHSCAMPAPTSGWWRRAAA